MNFAADRLVFAPHGLSDWAGAAAEPTREREAVRFLFVGRLEIAQGDRRRCSPPRPRCCAAFRAARLDIVGDDTIERRQNTRPGSSPAPTIADIADARDFHGRVEEAELRALLSRLRRAGGAVALRIVRPRLCGRHDVRQAGDRRPRRRRPRSDRRGRHRPARRTRRRRRPRRGDDAAGRRPRTCAARWAQAGRRRYEAQFTAEATARGAARRASRASRSARRAKHLVDDGDLRGAQRRLAVEPVGAAAHGLGAQAVEVVEASEARVERRARPAARAANSVRSRASRNGPAARAGERAPSAASSGETLQISAVQPLRGAAIARQPEDRLRGFGGESERRGTRRPAGRAALPRRRAARRAAARRRRPPRAAARRRAADAAAALDARRARRGRRAAAGAGNSAGPACGARRHRRRRRRARRRRWRAPRRSRVAGGNDQQRAHRSDRDRRRTGACA